MIRRFIAFLRSLWSKTPPPPAQVPPPACQDRPRPAKADKAEDTTFGAWTTMKGLLDQLADYFDVLRRVKTADPEGYSLYAKVGGQILPHNMMIYARDVPALWRGSPPSFGAVFISPRKDEDSRPDDMSARLLYFQRINSLLSRGSVKAVYRVTVYHESSDKESGVGSFLVALRSDGKATPVKEWQRKMVTQKNSHKPKIPQMVSDYPPTLHLMHDHYNKSAERAVSIEEYADFLFCLIANAAFQSVDGFQVRVRKRNEVACFNIPMDKTPYFFKDRDLTANDGGVRKRIFHIVRAHRRAKAAGGETFIKTHFRGERRFGWNGYSVLISMQGHHAPMTAEFTAETYENVGENTPEAKAMLPMPVAMELLGERLDR